MKLYLSTISISMIVITVLNAAFGAASLWGSLLAVVCCTALAFIFDGIVALVISLFPDSLFGVDNRHFRVSEREMELYRRLRVRLWKDKIWELGGIGGFSKKHLKDPQSPEYIEKFIIECNKGVLTHRLAYPIGFLVMLTVPGVCAYTVALPVAIVNLFLNILPTLALRYNTPKLKNLLARLKRRMEKQKTTR